jgi:hypothetical protein
MYSYVTSLLEIFGFLLRICLFRNKDADENVSSTLKIESVEYFEVLVRIHQGRHIPKDRNLGRSTLISSDMYNDDVTDTLVPSLASSVSLS